MSRPLGTSLEIGGTIFNTLKSLRSLVAAASEDDVHAQAVLAVERLGSLIPASPTRFGEAIDALGGQSSVRVENVKASIGMCSGGLCKAIRQSTSLLQFFLLCATCKTTLLDEDCGTLIYEMLKTSTVLSDLPCSAIQIKRLITAFSGQADSVAPADVMDAIGSAVDAFDPDPDVYRKLDLKVLAQLFMTLFENIRDDAVDTVILKGHENAIWLASAIVWLLEDKTHIMVDDTVVKGNPASKLCVQILPKSSEPWSLQAWKGNVDPLQFVFSTPADEVDTLHQMPLRNVKSFFNQYYWSAVEDPFQRRKATELSAQIAQTLILAIVQRGKLYLKRKCCKDKNYCNSQPLAKVATSAWLSGIDTILLGYGWNEQPPVVQWVLTEVLDELEKWDLNDRNLEDAERCIKAPFQRFIDSALPGVETDYILDPALFIAADAAVTCTAFWESGRRYIIPVDDQSIMFADKTIIALLSDGLDVSEFRNHAFRRLLPGLESGHDGDLIVARDGYVVGLNMIWSPSTQQASALSIRVQRGQIKKDRVVYDCIRESPFNSIVGYGPRVPAWDQPQGLIEPQVGWQYPMRERSYVFETSASTQGLRIDIKHYMAYNDTLTKTEMRRKASWLAAIDMLATSRHLDLEPSGPALHVHSPSITQIMSSRVKEVDWIDPYSAPKILEETGSLMRTSGKNIVKVFGASACNDFAEHCCTVLIRHRLPLLQCIFKASSAHRTWIIID